MDDTLSIVVEAEKGQIEVLDVLLESDALCPRVSVLDETGHIFEVFARARGDVL